MDGTTGTVTVTLPTLLDVALLHGVPINPELFVEGGLRHQAAMVNVDAYNQAMEVAATYRFLGLLAGVGPGDDVNAAREMVKDALWAALKAAIDTDQNQMMEMARQQYDQQRALAKQLSDPSFGDNHKSADLLTQYGSGSDIIAVLGGLNGPSYGGSATGNALFNNNRYRQTIPYIIGCPVGYYPPAYEALRTLENLKQELINAIDEKAKEDRKDNDDALTAIFENMWSSLLGFYNERVSEIQAGYWLYALGKTRNTAIRVIAEEALVEGILIALGLALGSLGFAATRTASAVVRVAIQSAKTLHYTSKGLVAGVVFRFPVIDPDLVLGRSTSQMGRLTVPNPGYTDSLEITGKDLLDTEKPVFSETNLGSAGRGGRGEPDQDFGSEKADVDPSSSNPDELTPQQRAERERVEQMKRDREVRQKLDEIDSDVPCFNIHADTDGPNLARQLRQQSSAIQNMTADEMIEAMEILDQARLDQEIYRQANPDKPRGASTDPARDQSAQDATRADFKKMLVENGVPKQKVNEILSGLDAAHGLDLSGGGVFDQRENMSMQQRGTNRAIGRQWSNTGPGGLTKTEKIRQIARQMQDAGLGDVKMPVEFEICR